MLLTGFDAPILQTMYLDKPLKEHRLLQAIARTNRPFNDIKEAGLIIDYIGLLNNFTAAFEAYTKEDIKGVLIDFDALRGEFTQKLNEVMKLFEEIPKDKYDRQTMMNAIEVVTQNEDNTKKFVDNYKELRKLFELLGTDQIKIEKFYDFKWLTAVYAWYINDVIQDRRNEDIRVQKYFNKTLKYVYKSTEIEKIEKELPIIRFDENYLKNLQEKAKNIKEKAANIIFTLNKYVLVDKQRNPIYESLTQRVEKIVELWKEKKKDYDAILAEGSDIFLEMNKLQVRQKQLNFTNLEYSLLLALENKFGTQPDLTQDTTELYTKLQALMFRDWQTQQTAKKNVEREVRTYLRKYVKKYGLKLSNLQELYTRLMENVMTYG